MEAIMGVFDCVDNDMYLDWNDCKSPTYVQYDSGSNKTSLYDFDTFG